MMSKSPVQEQDNQKVNDHKLKLKEKIRTGHPKKKQ